MKLLIATLATFSLAGAAIAADPTVAAPEAPAPVAKPAKPLVKDGDKLVCRSVRHTGSMMPQRECMTKSQRAARLENNRLEVEKAQSREPGNHFKWGGAGGGRQ